MVTKRKRKPGPAPEPFTEQRVRAYPVPSEGRVYYRDAKVPGLHLAVTATGSRTYYRVGRVNGLPSRVLIGRVGEVTLDTARKRAAELAGQVAVGRDPVAERRSAREVPTVSNLWANWLENHAKPRKRTWQDDERQWEKYIAPTFAKRRLSSITAAETIRWHRGIGEQHGPYQANRALALLSAMFAKGFEVGWSGPNPCRAVSRFPEQSRERFLSPDEVKRLLVALADEEPQWRDFFLLCLFTGARKSNVTGMRWADIDLDRRVWHLPATASKNKEPLVIVLPGPAVQVLESRLADRNGSTCPWVFPAARGDGPMVAPRKAWVRIIKTAGLEDVRIHDLRRTMGSWLAGAGESLPVIGKVLGHRSLQATQVYSRLSVDPIRAAVEKVAVAMLASGLPGPQKGSRNE